MRRRKLALIVVLTLVAVLALPLITLASDSSTGIHRPLMIADNTVNGTGNNGLTNDQGSGGSGGLTKSNVPYVAIIGTSVINFVAWVYFFYFIVYIGSFFIDYTLKSDTFLRKVTFGALSSEDPNINRKVGIQTVVSLFVLALYFSGAYLQLIPKFENIFLQLTDWLQNR